MPGLRHRALRGETSSTVLATSAATETPTARKASVLRPPSEANTANSQHGPHARLLLCSPGPAWRRWYPPPHCPHRAHGRPGSQGSQGSGAFLCATPPPLRQLQPPPHGRREHCLPCPLSQHTPSSAAGPCMRWSLVPGGASQVRALRTAPPPEASLGSPFPFLCAPNTLLPPYQSTEHTMLSSAGYEFVYPEILSAPRERLMDPFLIRSAHQFQNF